MKKLSNLLAALVFGSLVIFMSGGKDEGTPEPTTEELVAAALTSGSWEVTASSVTYGDTPEGDWTGFSITLSGNADGTATGNYTTSGTPEGYEDVWPASGTWGFVAGSKGKQIKRTGGSDNEVIMAVDIVQNNPSTPLKLTFEVDNPSGRISGLYDKPWEFTFTR